MIKGFVPSPNPRAANGAARNIGQISRSPTRRSGTAGAKLGTAILGFLATYISLAAGLYAFQRNILYLPDTARPDFRSVGLQSLREVELLTSDGVKLLAWYLPPPAGAPVLAYFHGNAGNLADRTRRLKRIADAGFGFLITEYRGYGGNPGQPSEQGLMNDGEAAMAFLRREGFGSERIVVYGESLGTGVATWIASHQPVAAMVLQSPYTSIAAIAARQFSFLPVDRMLKDRFDSLSRIAAVRAPILIVQGARDVVVPPDLGRALFAAAPEPKELWVSPKAGHDDLLAFGAGDVIADFIGRYVSVAR